MSNPNQAKVSQVRDLDDIDHQIIAAFCKADPATRQRALEFLRRAGTEEEAASRA